MANGEVERQNRTLLKALKVAQAEGKKWQDELPKFLLAYRTTPQSSTGATPAYLMFGRELKSKLPELRRDGIVLNESTRDRDWSNKLIQKTYADYRRKASDSQVLPGDQVLLKNTKSSGKLAPNFEAEPYTVLTKEGHELMLQSNEGAVYRRDSSFVKPFIPPAETQALETGNPVCSEPCISETPETITESVRPKRVIKLPEKFKDYVLDKPK